MRRASCLPNARDVLLDVQQVVLAGKSAREKLNRRLAKAKSARSARCKSKIGFWKT